MPRSVRSAQTAEAELQEFQGTMDTKLVANDIRMDSMEASIGDLQKGQTIMQQGFTELKLELASFMAHINAKLEPPPRGNLEKGESSHRNHHIEFHNNHNLPPPEYPPRDNNLPRFPRLDFPKFDGINPRGWVRKCEQYFEFCPIHEDYKVSYASVHFDAQAECWYAAYIKPLGRVRWEQFTKDLYARFSLTNGVSVMGSFNRLVQTGSIEEYFNQFEEMRAQVVQEFAYLDETYFCMSFIGGLKPEIRSRVEQFELLQMSTWWLEDVLLAVMSEIVCDDDDGGRRLAGRWVSALMAEPPDSLFDMSQTSLEMVSLNVFCDINNKVHERIWILDILTSLLILKGPRHQVVCTLGVNMESKHKALVQLQDISFNHPEDHYLVLHASNITIMSASCMVKGIYLLDELVNQGVEMEGWAAMYGCRKPVIAASLWFGERDFAASQRQVEVCRLECVFVGVPDLSELGGALGGNKEAAVRGFVLREKWGEKESDGAMKQWCMSCVLKWVQQ
ncbi:hypothetical protein RJ640_018308 [Escallonia rubra]|uniref:Ty3 transposon capsid-like protein domain-containing protein n=1 Tax=Escallonia rubra TaxID=112253 RepID=A0AA88SFD2_9ASTE|nr:hypothetical protein RJ640_018308 [Escallonia rubra]